MKAFLCLCALQLLAVTISSAADLDSVKTVKIDPKVPMPEDVYLENPDFIWGSPFGLIGATAVVIASDQDDFEAILKKNGAHIDQLVLQHFSEELKKSQLFKQIAAANPDATFHLNVEQYGMACPAFSTDHRPILEVQARLIDKSGAVLWKDSAKVNGLDERMPAHDSDDYVKNPSLFRSGYTKAAELVSAELIEKFKTREDTSPSAAPPRVKQQKTNVSGGKKRM